MAKMQRIPQVIVTIGPDGGLVAELPGTNGTRRQIPLKLDMAGPNLLRILNAQARGLSEDDIGLDSAPTRAQVEHWTKHAEHPSRTCQFCIAEGLVNPETRKAAVRRDIVKRTDGIEIKRITAKTKGQAPVVLCNKSLEELDL